MDFVDCDLSPIGLVGKTEESPKWQRWQQWRASLYRLVPGMHAIDLVSFLCYGPLTWCIYYDDTCWWQVRGALILRWRATSDDMFCLPGWTCGCFVLFYNFAVNKRHRLDVSKGRRKWSNRRGKTACIYVVAAYILNVLCKHIWTMI